jgi:hypothetical protein
MNNFRKTRPVIVSILVLLATFIVGLGIYRMCLPNYRDGDYRLNEAITWPEWTIWRRGNSARL